MVYTIIIYMTIKCDIIELPFPECGVLLPYVMKSFLINKQLEAIMEPLMGLTGNATQVS